VNLVRTVPSAKFICCCWGNPWCDCYVTHSPKCNANIINYALTTFNVSLFALCRLRITTQLRSGICHCWQNGRYFYKTHLATQSLIKV